MLCKQPYAPVRQSELPRDQKTQPQAAAATGDIKRTFISRCISLGGGTIIRSEHPGASEPVFAGERSGCP